MVNRRKFVTMGVALTAAVPAMQLITGEVISQKLGPMTPERFQNDGFKERGFRIFADGEDITSRCSYVDDVKQFAYCFRHNSKGTAYLVKDGKTGDVFIAHDVFRKNIEWRQVRTA